MHLASVHIGSFDRAYCDSNNQNEIVSLMGSKEPT